MGVLPSRAVFSALICCGVVPQHPPTIETPFEREKSKHNINEQKKAQSQMLLYLFLNAAKTHILIKTFLHLLCIN